jgi:hypothetical protein
MKGVVCHADTGSVGRQTEYPNMTAIWRRLHISPSINQLLSAQPWKVFNMHGLHRKMADVNQRQFKIS